MMQLCHYLHNCFGFQKTRAQYKPGVFQIDLFTYFSKSHPKSIAYKFPWINKNFVGVKQSCQREHTIYLWLTKTSCALCLMRPSHKEIVKRDFQVTEIKHLLFGNNASHFQISHHMLLSKALDLYCWKKTFLNYNPLSYVCLQSKQRRYFHFKRWHYFRFHDRIIL